MESNQTQYYREKREKSQSSSKNKNLTMKELIQRDKELALKHRQRLDSARNRKNPNYGKKSTPSSKNFEMRPKSSTKTRGNKRSMTITKEKKESSGKDTKSRRS